MFAIPARTSRLFRLGGTLTKAPRRPECLVAGFLVGLIALSGCEKPSGDADASASPAPVASPSASTEAKPAEQAKPSPTTRAEAKPQRTPAVAAKTPKPTASQPARPSTTAGQGAKAVTAADQQRAESLSAQANLPAPPDLNTLPPSVARHLVNMIAQAAENPTEDTIGWLGCLYHDIMQNRDDSERARECYERAKELNPQSYVWPHLLGRLFLRRQSFVRARMEFNKSIELNPEYADNHAWLGDLALRSGAAEDAKAHYQRFNELAPQESYGHFGIADAELELGNLDAVKPAVDRGIAINPRSRRAHIVLAKYYERKGDERLALRHRGFSERLTVDPVSRTDPINDMLTVAGGPTAIAINRVRVLATSRDMAGADRLRAQLLERYGDNALLHAGLAEVDLLVGRMESAREHAETALRLDPNLPQAHVTLADYYLAAGDPTKALEQGDRAIQLDPDVTAGHVAKARAYEVMQQPAEALAAYQAALAQQPDNLMLEIRVGNALIKADQLDAAHDWCMNRVTQAEADGNVTPLHAELYVALANIAQTRGDGKVAVESYKRALMADPSREIIFRQLAQLLIQLGRGEEARKIGERLMNAQPQSLDYAISYGNLLSSLGQFDAAVAHIQSIIAELPTHPAPHYALATVYLDHNELDKAKAALETVLAHQPDHEHAHLMLLDIARRKGDHAAAIAHARAGLAESPDSVLIGNSLAWMLATCPEASLRDPQAAVELAEKVATRSQRAMPNYLDTLACAYASAGRFDDAVRVAREAVDLAGAQDQPDLAAEFGSRVSLFESKQAYVEQ
jgi:tetratricopeptide (TPR) repeat protein